ncbi:hypothetical protein HYT02_00080 [Candidatus Gottesmanbacteria bacterium]|nr:hypothetical protein [Candidatus Gottesmanbacteria bacterium]
MSAESTATTTGIDFSPRRSLKSFLQSSEASRNMGLGSVLWNNGSVVWQDTRIELPKESKAEYIQTGYTDHTFHNVVAPHLENIRLARDILGIFPISAVQFRDTEVTEEIVDKGTRIIRRVLPMMTYEPNNKTVVITRKSLKSSLLKVRGAFFDEVGHRIFDGFTISDKDQLLSKQSWQIQTATGTRTATVSDLDAQYKLHVDPDPAQFDMIARWSMPDSSSANQHSTYSRTSPFEMVAVVVSKNYCEIVDYIDRKQLKGTAGQRPVIQFILDNML